MTCAVYLLHARGWQNYPDGEPAAENTVFEFQAARPWAKTGAPHDRLEGLKLFKCTKGMPEWPIEAERTTVYPAAVNRT